MLSIPPAIARSVASIQSYHCRIDHDLQASVVRLAGPLHTNNLSNTGTENGSADGLGLPRDFRQDDSWNEKVEITLKLHPL